MDLFPVDDGMVYIVRVATKIVAVFDAEHSEDAYALAQELNGNVVAIRLNVRLDADDIEVKS